jgi:hypothetical protein
MVVAQGELVEPKIELENAVRRPDERERGLDWVVKAGGDPKSHIGRVEGLAQTDKHFGALCELWVHHQSLIAPYREVGILADVCPQQEDTVQRRRR